MKSNVVATNVLNAHLVVHFSHALICMNVYDDEYVRVYDDERKSERRRTRKKEIKWDEGITSKTE